MAAFSILKFPLVLLIEIMLNKNNNNAVLCIEHSLRFRKNILLIFCDDLVAMLPSLRLSNICIPDVVGLLDKFLHSVDLLSPTS